MQIDQRTLTSLAGFLAVGVLMTGGVIAAHAYRGNHGEAFSIREHYISHLGEVGVSPYAAHFNASLMLGGLALAAFMVGLGRYLRVRWSRLAAANGVAAGLSCGLVGLVPRNDPQGHALAAFLCFNSSLTTITFFCFTLFRDRQEKLSRWLIAPGAITMVSYVSFLLTPQRPPLLEWIVAGALLAWLGLTAASLTVRRQCFQATAALYLACTCGGG